MMLVSLLSLAALVSGDAPVQPAPTTTPAVQSATTTNVKADRFAGRPQTRIAFAHEVNNFQVKRDGNDDILFLETRRDRWFRSEINCFGISDPRDAQGLVPLDRTSGFDRFSRVALVSFGHERTECLLDGLVELTSDEATELGLIRRRRGGVTAPTPAS
jgi:hypothetical protein